MPAAESLIYKPNLNVLEPFSFKGYNLVLIVSFSSNIVKLCGSPVSPALWTNGATSAIFSIFLPLISVIISPTLMPAFSPGDALPSTVFT